ncbi:MAG: hypothetical protein QM535_16905 [Limnohabitans sp.]|nr:hypothetical protein [Limnohabitans sp.]
MDIKTIHTHIDNKWIKIIGISEDIKKGLFDFEGDNLIGYVYIDHTAGVTLDIFKLFDIVNEEIKFRESPIDKNLRVISRLNGIVKSKEIHLLSKEAILEYDLKVPEYIVKYERPNLKDFRLNEKFHKYRAEGFPDDVQILLLPSNSLNPELIWGRVENFENNTLEFQLLNQPHQSFGVQMNDMLKASIQNFGEEEYIVCEVDVKTDSKIPEQTKKAWWKFW